MKHGVSDVTNYGEVGPVFFDLGHHGDVDRTQILRLLRMTPTERLRHHERWRYFLKEVAPRAKLLRGTPPKADCSEG
ncbi:MAG: hypothetical protein U0793_19645 [Gemmataceae bacterium]